MSLVLGLARMDLVGWWYINTTSSVYDVIKSIKDVSHHGPHHLELNDGSRWWLVYNWNTKYIIVTVDSLPFLCRIGLQR